MLKRCFALIVESDLAARTKLRETIKSLAHSQKVTHARSIKNALELFDYPQPLDAIFIASSFGLQEIVSVLRTMREAMQGATPPAVIVVLKAEAQDGAFISQLLLEGVSGFLCDPYSSETVLSLLQKTQEITTLGVTEKQYTKAALEIQIRDAAVRIDELSYQKTQGGAAGGVALKELKKFARAMQEKGDLDPHQYGMLLAKVFGEASTKKIEATVRKDAHVAVKTAPHPGQVIVELMFSRSISQEKLLALLKWEPSKLEALLAQNVGVDESDARDIARALGKTSDYWLGLQTAYEQTR